MLDSYFGVSLMPCLKNKCFQCYQTPLSPVLMCKLLLIVFTFSTLSLREDGCPSGQHCLQTGPAATGGQWRHGKRSTGMVGVGSAEVWTK